MSRYPPGVVAFSLDCDVQATCLACGRDIDPDALCGCERVLEPSSPDGGKVYAVEKPGACPQCGGSRVKVVMSRGRA